MATGRQYPGFYCSKLTARRKTCSLSLRNNRGLSPNTVCSDYLTPMLGSSAPWNIKSRLVSAGNSLAPGDSAYIESHRADGHNYGCSFIEFDGKGGFLGIDQFENALKVLETRKAQSDVLLVIYCHGGMKHARSTHVLHVVICPRRLA